MMRSSFKWIFTLLVVLTVQFSFAQGKNVTGVVSDDLGPIAGASVVVKGTNNGTTTGFDGTYSIRASQGDVLLFSYVGSTEAVTVGEANVYNVLLKVVELVEVVVVEGYDRTKTKATTNTTSTTVSSETIENRPNASVLASLQGTTPGLTLISSSGSPGSAKFDGFIRGASSINGSTDPLIVIDGIPSTSNQFRNLNQNDIESVTVLRDAAGTSIYGNKGANGVIQITTKNAKFDSGVKFTYDVVTGFNTLPENDYNMSNAREVLTIEKRKATNGGLGTTLTDEEIAAYDIDTDWRDVFFNVDVTQQHNFGVSFGSENTTNYTSLGYYTQGGLVPTTDFKRFSLRNNFQAKSKNDKFTLDTQIALAHSKRNQLNQETNNGINNNTIQNPLHGSVMGLPYAPPSPYNSGQELLDAIGFNFNGVNDTYVLQDILRPNSLPSFFTENSVILNIGTAYKITPSLSIRNRAGLDVKDSDGVFARSPWSYLALAVQTSRGEAFGGFENRTNTKDLTFTNIFSLDYNKTINEKHKFNFGAFFEYTKAHYISKTQFQNGLNPLNYVPGAGTGYVAFNPATPNSFISTAAGSKFSGGTLSYFGTLDYDYNDKYGFSGVIRRDASYRFVGDNKWGTFWSAAARWNIDKESFMEGSSFSMLKLRASYGTNGNQNISAANYGFPSLLTANNLVRDLNATGNGYQNIPGIFISQIANTTLSWEEVSQANLGVDFVVFDKKLEGNIDVYRKVTDKLFNSINTSATVGTYTLNANNGKLKNDGVEVNLRYNIIRNDNFRFSVFANGSYNKNEITELLENDQSGVSQLLQVGNIVNEWNLIPYVGVNQGNGNLLFLDKDGNVTETPDAANDRRATGKSNLPKYQGGFGFNTDYKGFFLNTLFSYAYDVWRIDNQLTWAYNPDFIGDDNVSADLLNAWTPQNTNTNIPSLSASNTSLSGDSDRFLYDSSFLRLKNVSVGYNFPAKMLQNTPISSLRFYAQGENLLTWTKWRGFDPEAITSLSVTNFPNPRTISFGASIGF
ncbi:SusC/RagA family TonB-linked outer membrane protein [Flavobacterium sp. HNIBRBA15423]|uniref:SusC/RagA family TonB-linked outer membrane protein n=1 Tax=Flavobacterium sp. HNIBRBA15423 TaxID=3458683 RepID=UPI004043FC10